MKLELVQVKSPEATAELELVDDTCCVWKKYDDGRLLSILHGELQESGEYILVAATCPNGTVLEEKVQERYFNKPHCSWTGTKITQGSSMLYCPSTCCVEQAFAEGYYDYKVLKHVAQRRRTIRGVSRTTEVGDVILLFIEGNKAALEFMVTSVIGDKCSDEESDESSDEDGDEEGDEEGDEQGGESPTSCATVGAAQVDQDCTDFFLSHTQRDDGAKLMASELYLEFNMQCGKSCWLDVKMKQCDIGAMQRGVKGCGAFLALMTDNGEISYLSRQNCRQELEWAEEYGKPIVLIVRTEDKHKVASFIAEASKYGYDISGLNFCTFDRSGPNQVLNYPAPLP